MKALVVYESMWRNTEEVATDELYVQKVRGCTEGGRFLIFADNDARDAFVETAEGFGSGPYQTGGRWAYEPPAD